MAKLSIIILALLGLGSSGFAKQVPAPLGSIAPPVDVPILDTTPGAFPMLEAMQDAVEGWSQRWADSPLNLKSGPSLKGPAAVPKHAIKSGPRLMDGSGMKK